jgi:hypothetical protein
MDAQKSEPFSQTDVETESTGAPHDCQRRSHGFHTLWMALLAAAIVAVGFGVSYLAYANLTSHVPAASVETLGELWDGGAP